MFPARVVHFCDVEVSDLVCDPEDVYMVILN